MQLQSIGSYETKTHLADLLRRVRAGEGFTITQRGEPVADLVPAGAAKRRVGAEAAEKMRVFMRNAPKVKAGAIKQWINEGRD